MMFSFRSLRAATTVMALATLASCSKKSDDTPAPAAANTEGMSWTVDGANVTAAVALSQTLGSTFAVSGTTSASGAGTSVTLFIPKTAGTYTLAPNGTNTALYAVTPASGNSAIYDATTGTIVVSSVTATNISGTFTFTGSTGSATKAISNGKFNVKL
ncbi:DUF6252 domain-containing protein [Hymenobacter ruber]